MKRNFTVRKSGDNYIILFRGTRAEGPPHATRETAKKYAILMEKEMSGWTTSWESRRVSPQRVPRTCKAITTKDAQFGSGSWWSVRVHYYGGNVDDSTHIYRFDTEVAANSVAANLNIVFRREGTLHE